MTTTFTAAQQAHFVEWFRTAVLKATPDPDFIVGLLAAALSSKLNNGEPPKPSMEITPDGIPTGGPGSPMIDSAAQIMVKRFAKMFDDHHISPDARLRVLDSIIAACRNELRDVYGLEARVEWYQ